MADRATGASAGDSSADASDGPDDAPTYIDTKLGMVTGAGTWFHIREDDLHAYAGEVLEYASVADLLRWAETWLRSARTVTLWLLPLLLWTLPDVGAAAAGVVLYVVWRLAAPSFPSDRVAAGFTYLDHAVVLGLYYVATLSVLAGMERYAAVGIGLFFFVTMRLGIFESTTTPLLRPLWTRIYPLPLPDQVLRALVIRIALRRRLPVPQIDELASEMMDRWNTRRSDDAKSPDDGAAPG